MSRQCPAAKTLPLIETWFAGYLFVAQRADDLQESLRSARTLAAAKIAARQTLALNVDQADRPPQFATGRGRQSNDRNRLAKSCREAQPMRR